MTRPTVRLPTWATDGGADITDPGSSKQADGWVEGEAPAADHTNWLLNNLGQWIDYFDDSITFGDRLIRRGFTDTGVDLSESISTSRTYQYLPGVDQYWVTGGNSSTYPRAWSSSDGLTWSAWSAISSVRGISNAATDGTRVRIVISNTGTNVQVYETTSDANSLSLHSTITWPNVNFSGPRILYTGTNWVVTGRSASSPWDADDYIRINSSGTTWSAPSWTGDETWDGTDFGGSGFIQPSGADVNADGDVLVEYQGNTQGNTVISTDGGATFGHVQQHSGFSLENVIYMHSADAWIASYQTGTPSLRDTYMSINDGSSWTNLEIVSHNEQKFKTRNSVMFAGLTNNDEGIFRFPFYEFTKPVLPGERPNIRYLGDIDNINYDSCRDVDSFYDYLDAPNIVVLKGTRVYML